MDFQKVRAGDPIRLPAATYNAILDATVAYQQDQASPGGRNRPPRQSTSVVFVKNTTGVNLDQYACVQVDAPMTLPADNANEFKVRIGLKVVKPTAAKLPWAILAEPLAAGPSGDETNGAIGLAVIDGITICRINLLANTDTAVDSSSGLTIPQSGNSGAAAIVWVLGGVGTATGTGEQWAVIRVGGGGGGGSGLPPAGDQYTALVAVASNVWGIDYIRLHGV